MVLVAVWFLPELIWLALGVVIQKSRKQDTFIQKPIKSVCKFDFIITFVCGLLLFVLLLACFVGILKSAGTPSG